MENWSPPSFRIERTVQAAAYYLNLARCEDKGYLDKSKLVKLLYMLDRESLRRRGYAVTYDDYFSMQHGPVLRNTLNLMDGNRRNDAWDDCFVTDGNENVSLRGEMPYLSRISRSDREIMDEIYGKFGGWPSGKLKEYTHKFPEYSEVEGGGRSRIKIEDILKAVDYSPEEIKMTIEDIRCTGYRERLLGL